MSNTSWRAHGWLSVPVLGLFAAFWAPPATILADGKGGSVYVMTNHPTGNTIAAFDRLPDGSLQPSGEFPTGGLGTGGGSDPLRSQHSLIVSSRSSGGHDPHDGRDFDSDLSARHDDDDDDDGGGGNGTRLFVVNAGSNEISVLAVGAQGLTLVHKVSSGGIRPTSLALHGRLLYVLNAGSGDITGFVVGRSGRLTPLPGSTRSLTGGAAADPSQVSFTPDGRLLVVTEKAPNVIDTFLVGRDGRPIGPRSNASNGMTPFGFGFDQRDNLIVSEAFGGAPEQAAVSSYDVSSHGRLRVVSGSVRDFQTAACWIVITRNGRYVYTSNTDSRSVSSYGLRPDGRLRLLDSMAASTDPGGSPIDMALSSRYLYVLNGVVGTVNVFRVAEDGRLEPRGGVGGLPPYAQGIAID